MYAIISTLTRSKVRTDHAQDVFFFTHEANVLIFTDIGGCDGVLFFVITPPKSSNRTKEFRMMWVDMICLPAGNKAIFVVEYANPHGFDGSWQLQVQK
jgi:hypothetical protein